MRIVLLLAVLGACSISHRSDQFACDDQNRCDPGKSCQDGFCVTMGTPGDGPVVDPDGSPPPDTLTCPAQCTSCNLNTMTCTVDCNVSPATCGAAINCPAGFNCNILCTRNDLCQNINCTQGESCNIVCKGNTTCKNVVCGPGKCDVDCTGMGSCRGVNCGDSCACDVSCGNNVSCLQVTCPDLQCSGFGLERCTSAPDGCHNCQ